MSMKIAIVGGIGSGKSEVLKVARELGLATLSADEINAQLLETPDYIAELGRIFPTVVSDGKIDRQKLANIVFSDEAQLKKLNALAHPRILQVIKDNKSDLLVVEMPLLLESGAQGLFDKIVLVHTSLKVRIDRLKVRGLSEEQSISRINAQVSEDCLRAVADEIIDNSAGLDELRASAKNLFCALCDIR